MEARGEIAMSINQSNKLRSVLRIGSKVNNKLDLYGVRHKFLIDRLWYYYLEIFLLWAVGCFNFVNILYNYDITIIYFVLTNTNVLTFPTN